MWEASACRLLETGLLTRTFIALFAFYRRANIKEQEQIMEQYISRQQVNELRLVVFQVVNGWYEMMCFTASWCGDGEDVLLENCSPKMVRCIVWDYFEQQFKTKDGCLDLPKSRYGDAKHFIKNVKLDSVRAWAYKEGLLEVLPEKRPSGEEIRRRTQQGINAHRAKNGYPPLKMRKPKAPAHQ